MAPVPTLSVLMACHNHGHFLPRAIASVLGQTRMPDEIVLIDDGSTDRTGEIMRDCVARHPGRARFIRNDKNAGIIGVVQQGVDAMQGDYIAFCAADDVLFPKFCENAMRLLEAHPQAALFTALGRSIDEAGRDLGLDTGPVPADAASSLSPEACARKLVEHDSWFLGYTTVYRRAALTALGPYDSRLGPFFDNFTSRILSMKHGACFAPEPLAAARKAPSTFSATFSSDPAVMAEIGKLAMELLREKYRDFVPADYAEAFERRFRYLTGSSVVHWGAAALSARLKEVTATERAYGIPWLFDGAALIAKAILFWCYRRGEIMTTFRQRSLNRALARRWPPGRFNCPI